MTEQNESERIEDNNLALINKSYSNDDKTTPGTHTHTHHFNRRREQLHFIYNFIFNTGSLLLVNMLLEVNEINYYIRDTHTTYD